MKRVFTIIHLLIRTALRGLQSSPGTTIVAVLTIAVTLVLVGSFALLVGNMRGLLDRFGVELQVTAYLEDDLDPDATRLLVTRVATVEGVQHVEYVSRDQALARFQKSLGTQSLLEGLDDNPLPASLQISLLEERRTPEGLAVLEQALTGLPGISELAHGREWIEGYARAVALMRFAAVGLGSVLGFAALMIVANTIRLALYAREVELEILALVGASRTFVRVPFLLEGTLQGVLGGFVAAAILYLAFLVFLPQIQYGLAFFLGNAEPRFFDAGELFALILGGAALGVLGSATALLGWRGSAG